MFNTTQWLQQLEHNSKPLALWREMLNTLASTDSNCQCALMVKQQGEYKMLIANDNQQPICDWESIETGLSSLFAQWSYPSEAQSQQIAILQPEFQAAFEHTPIKSLDCAPVYWPNGTLFAQLCTLSSATSSPMMAGVSPHFARLVTSDLKQFIEQRSSLLTDDLTELLNPQGFAMLGAQKVKDAPRYQLAIGVIYIQIDRVSEISAAYGSDIAEQCYTTLSDVLKSACREADIVARINDNEFVVLSLLNTRRQLNQLAHRIENDFKLRVKATETLNLSSLLSKTFITDCFSSLSLDQLVEKTKFQTAA